jgi:hypothetical protein
MKQCLNCNKEYEAKREASKFCSTSCRVMWNRAQPKGKNKVTQMDMQELYNAVLGAINSINTKNGQPEAVAFVFEQRGRELPIMTYDNAKVMIGVCTSAVQLEDAWRQILKQEWAGWQKRELERLKELQQTKLEF